MKRLLLILGVLASLAPSSVSAKSWQFDRWNVSIDVQPDSSILVREEQTFRFDGQFSWVTRDLPSSKGILYDNLMVQDASGRQLKGREVEIKDNIKSRVLLPLLSLGKNDNQSGARFKLNFNLQDTTATWTFVYRAWNALGFFDDHDELYWNAVSVDRGVPIQAVTVRLHLPQAVDPAAVRLKLFIGPTGSTSEATTFRIVDDQTLEFTGSTIAPRENFTIVAGWPKGIVTPTTHTKEPTRQSVVAIIGLFLVASHPLFILAFLFRRWLTHGRDPEGRKTIVPQFEPPDHAPPAAVGVLMDERADARDLTATIVDLAVRGYLKITETREGLFKTKKFSFTRLRPSGEEPGLAEFERSALDALFETGDVVTLDDLRNKFYKHLKDIKSSMYQAAVSAGWFPESPERVRRTYIFVGVAFFVSVVLFGMAVDLGAQYWWVFVPPVVDGLLFVLFGFILPRRTVTGVQAREWALGFKQYLHTAERFRIKAMTPETFERFLPYAMVFRVEKEWAKAFEGVLRQEPSWYASPGGAQFSAFAFASGLSSSMHSTVAGALASSPSSSSGFGGGFGGGGGGGGGSGAG